MRASTTFAIAFVVACGTTTGASSTSPNEARTDWGASTVSDASATHVTIDPQKPWKDATAAIAGDACPDATLVWGDLRVEEELHARAVSISIGDAKPVIRGYLICTASMEAFLKLQTLNPRIKAGHGGSADLKWRDGQLFMRRRWSAADIPLGRLSPPPSDVFQKGEALAAITSSDDPSAPPADVLTALSHAPTVFVFGMLPLR